MQRGQIVSLSMVFAWLASSPCAIHAQSAPTGLHIGAGLGLATARFSGDTRAVVAAAGSVELGPVYGMRVGYDFDRVGFSLGVDADGVLQNRHEEVRSGSVTLLSLMAHWRLPAVRSRSVYPFLSVGGLYQALSTHDVPNQSIPSAAAGIQLESDGATNLTLSGPGARIGVGAGWLWRSNAMIVADFSTDIVRYRNLAGPGSDEGVSLNDPGTTLMPRLVLELQLWPF